MSFVIFRLSPVLPGSMSSPGTSRLIVDRLQCVGNETDVAQCPSSAWLGTGITCSVTTGVEIDCGAYALLTAFL